MSLRDELMGIAPALPAAAPPFVLLLPSGWVSVPATKEAFAELMARAGRVFRAQHRPDLDAQLRGLVERSAEELLRRDAVRLIYQQDVPADLMIPMSITVFRVTEPSGAPLDGRVRALVQGRGAKPLDGAGVIMRWTSEHTHEAEGGRVSTRSFDYLVPIPETGRRQALMFNAVVPIEAGEDPASTATLELFADALMTTFRWSGA
ncbi:hypothetical protein [Agromyces archimandritae]|uniref:Uncharacterized protein n=1 Tax=Agromyces archimandritae TaxID=2781962 RepID=A0A975FPW2_9MICO|nr:hypothetical protein [Agromyces archimandritae]QTX05503.1 hypothetical protein G127AT_04610 [Agromyces archimandritae]